MSLVVPAAIAQTSQPLSSAVIRQGSVYTATELFAVYQPFLGRPVTADTAGEIAEAVRNRYREDGYSRPGYRIADDGRQNGIVRIVLVEPSISGVRLNGHSGPHRERLETLFGGIPSGTTLRPTDIREVISQARRLPGLDVNIATRPDEQVPGSYVLEVDSDYRPVNGSMTYTNRGTEQIGRNLVFARLESNGPFGNDNVLGLTLASAGNHNDYSSGGLFLRAPLGESGTTAFLQGSVAAIQIVSSGILVDQDRERYTFRLARPLPDWDGRRVTMRAALEFDDLDVYYDGVPARRDRLRSLESALTLTWRGGVRQHLLTTEAELGFDAFGGGLDNYANPDDGRRADFAILRLHYVDLTKLGEHWSLRVDGYAQHSPHRLPSIRQFKVGGGRIGRGFDAAALRGDRGLGGKAEIRRRLAVDAGWFERLEAYGFYDLGAAWDYAAGARESAASTGIGVAIRGDTVSGYLELAQPLTHPDADGETRPGLFVELTGRF